MAYKDAMLYFLSGTGNTYRAMTWMAERLRVAGVETQMRPIRAGEIDAQYEPVPDSLLVLAFPVHAFTAPWLMARFAARLPRGHGMGVAVVACNSGLSATSLYLIGLLLWLRGYRVRGLIDVVMPNNWTSLVPSPKPEKVQAMIEQAEGKLAEDVDALLAGRRLVPGPVTALWALLLLPVAVAYLLWGRFFLAKLFFASDQCIGCGQCAAYCPWHAIKMRDRDGQLRPYWTLKCESCMRCMGYCPTQAIEAGHSWAVILGTVSSVPVGWWLLNWLSRWIPALADANRGVLPLLAQFGYLFLSTVAAYHLFAALLRVPAINRFFTRTTFTHRYRRYHEPDTRVQDME